MPLVLLLAACFPIADGAGDQAPDDDTGPPSPTDGEPSPDDETLHFFRNGDAEVVVGHSWTGTETLRWYTDDGRIDCEFRYAVRSVSAVDTCGSCDWAFVVELVGPPEPLTRAGCDEAGADPDAYDGRAYGYGFEADTWLEGQDTTLDAIRVSQDPEDVEAPWEKVGEMYGGTDEPVVVDYFWLRVDTPL